MIIILLIVVITSFFTIQSIFSLLWMLYAWEDPHNLDSFQSPKHFVEPQLSFTALIPARFEEKVIKDTILALSEIDYPEDLKEVLILCRQDDISTIQKVEKLLQNVRNIRRKNIRLITFNDFPINKPHSLNIGLRNATKDILVVFDAEDQPHKDIYSVVNTIFKQRNINILQSGVQLINYQSRWFSVLNVLEYYFWFKSGLHFFSNIIGITPLAGNTVFFKKELIQKVNGWDEKCLTEDAELTFRLLNNGGTIGVVYDEQHVTYEETPLRLKDFIKQRTRWNQGFLQVFSKLEWMKLPYIHQRLLSAYILLSPLIQLIFFLYIPFSIWITLFFRIPLPIALFSLIPFYLFGIQLFLYIFAFTEFNKSYKLHAPLWTLGIIALTFYPYQLILAYSSARACVRNLLNLNQWEKTSHINLHRKTYFTTSKLSYA